MTETTATTATQDRRRAVLETVRALCDERGYGAVTTAGVAERCGVPEEELTRSWPSKAAMVIDAFRVVLAPALVFPDTGDFAADLRAQLTAFGAAVTDPGVAPHLTALVADAQTDPDVAATFVARVFEPNRAVARARFTAARQAGQLRDDIDLDAAIDLVFAPLWFRLLLHTGPVDAEYAARIAALALRGLAPAPETAA